jgi:hypothetical protein
MTGAALNTDSSQHPRVGCADPVVPSRPATALLVLHIIAPAARIATRAILSTGPRANRLVPTRRSRRRRVARIEHSP